MKLKYYMRGLGIGILITTLIFAAAGKKEKLTDERLWPGPRILAW